MLVNSIGGGRQAYFFMALILCISVFFDNANFCAAEVKLAVQGSDNKSCIVLGAREIAGTVHYMDKDGNPSVFEFTVPANVNTSSSTDVTKSASHCGQHNQLMTIEFMPVIKSLEARNKWYLTLQFNKTANSEHRYVLANYSLNASFLSGQKVDKVDYTMSGTPEWTGTLREDSNQTQALNGFSCSENTLTLSNDSSLVFKDLKVVAFYNSSTSDFLAGQGYELCSLDVRTSSLVPIIVGALLAGLVIVVLIAYLIGRARAKRQGYASV